MAPTSEYPGLLRRFLAAFIDGMLIMALVPLDIAILSVSGKGLYLAWAWADCFLGVVYLVVCHALWSQTLGKRLLGIRVVRLSGSRISWRDSLLRNVAEGIGALGMAAYATYAIAGFDWSTLAGMEWGPKYNAVSSALQPPLWTVWVTAAWYVAEIVVMLVNPKRRALHDYIAGTVVGWKKSG